MRDIDRQLHDAVLAGNIALGRFLMEQGADINSRNSIGCTPLMHASNKGNLPYVEMLLECGADRDLKSDNGNTAFIWADGSAQEEIRRLLNDWSPGKKQEDLAQKENQVIFISKISNRTLEEIFNFASRERISLVRNTPGGPVEAVMREDFSDIKNQELVQKAFEEYRNLGGTISEAEVFPDKIIKMKMPRLGDAKP